MTKKKEKKKKNAQQKNLLIRESLEIRKHSSSTGKGHNDPQLCVKSNTWELGPSSQETQITLGFRWLRGVSFYSCVSLSIRNWLQPLLVCFFSSSSSYTLPFTLRSNVCVLRYDDTGYAFVRILLQSLVIDKADWGSELIRDYTVVENSGSALFEMPKRLSAIITSHSTVDCKKCWYS